VKEYCERCQGEGVVDWAQEEVDPDAPVQLVFDLGVALKQPCPACSLEQDEESR
jgi:hypothetical protein